MKSAKPLNNKNNETVTFAWIDNGLVDGKFADSLINTIFKLKNDNVNITGSFRVSGNQIPRQRQTLIDYWYNNIKSDWILWLDSDIIVTPESFKLLWESADKELKPVVCGVYFISKQSELSLMEPMPSIFMDTENKYVTQTIYPLPENQLIPVDTSGFGFVLMHKSIIPKVVNISKNLSVFAENQEIGNNFISEDISFFRKLKKCGIQLYAHTGALVEHMKRFSLDINYYNLYWADIEDGRLVKPNIIEKKHESF